MPTFELMCECGEIVETSITATHTRALEQCETQECTSPLCGQVGKFTIRPLGGTGFQLSMRGTDGKTQGCNTHGWSSRGRCMGKEL